MTDYGWSQRNRYTRRGFERVASKLAPNLQSGETVESAVLAHRYVPGLILLVFLGSIGDLVFMLVARPYYLALTNQRFFLLKAKRFGLSFVPRVGATAFEAPASTARLEEPKRFLLRKTTRLDVAGQSELRLTVHRQYWGELDHMRSLLGS